MVEENWTSQILFEKEFLEYLLLNMVITPENKADICNAMMDGKGLDQILQRFLTLKEIRTYRSAYFGISRVSLSEISIDPLAIRLISEELARRHIVIPLSVQKGKMLVAMADPTNRAALDDVSFYSGYPAEPFLADAEEIIIAIREYYTVGKSAEGQSSPRYSNTRWIVHEETEAGGKEPVVRLVDSFLRQAVNEKASDVHWEPKEDHFLIKFRIDGYLEKKSQLPIELARSTAARLKIMAGMDVTERRIPQDGRIVLELPDKKIDIRVSSFPTVSGEKIVTRILDDETARRSLSELGMRKDVEEGVRKLIRQPYGLILVSGPTGSGKTTTLYALLREIPADCFNLVSVEDPVEYRLPGVNQAQVNTRIGFDFAGGLRAILRQDPDIIMVGEIRDQETAQIATAAALTGHLVLSTVHTNSAAEAFVRMLDMEIEPFMLAASVCGVVAQRLVRRLCPHCREESSVSLDMKKTFGWEDVERIYRPKGCTKCRGTGYHGRIGIHEYLPYSQEIKQLILRKSNARRIEEIARSQGMLTLREDALLKVVQGETSLEEVMRLSAGV
jgi:type IV pilus assembly protein PilB